MSPDDTKICDIAFADSEHANTRIKNTLQRAGIMTLGQLRARYPDDLPQGTGVISRAHIQMTLEKADQ